jgi:hypothetical protein
LVELGRHDRSETEASLLVRYPFRFWLLAYATGRLCGRDSCRA